MLLRLVVTTICCYNYHWLLLQLVDTTVGCIYYWLLLPLDCYYCCFYTNECNHYWFVRIVSSSKREYVSKSFALVFGLFCGAIPEKQFWMEKRAR